MKMFPSILLSSYLGDPSVKCTHLGQQFSPKGVYPQSDGSLGIVDIDASKGFVDLWEHLALANFANFDVKSQLKWLLTKI